MKDDHPTTEELRRGQEERETAEHRLAEQSELPDETAQHERRAAKSAYLKQKLEERERSEREAQDR